MPKKGFWERFFTGRFPAEDKVVTRLRERMAGVG